MGFHRLYQCTIVQAALLYFPCLIAILRDCYWYHTPQDIHRIVYVSECWGEIISKWKYVNRSNSIVWSWPLTTEHVYNITYHIACAVFLFVYFERASEVASVLKTGEYIRVVCVCVCIFDFRFISSKLKRFSILWFHFYAVFVDLGCFLEFDQGLFIALLLLQIDPSMHFSFPLAVYIRLSIHPPLPFAQSVAYSKMSAFLFRSRFILFCYESLYFRVAFLAIFKSGIAAEKCKKKTEKE